MVKVVKTPAPRQAVAAAIVTLSSVLYLVAIYSGAARALENFLDLPYAACIVSVLVIVTAPVSPRIGPR